MMQPNSIDRKVAAQPATVSSMTWQAQWGYHADRATSPGRLTDREIANMRKYGGLTEKPKAIKAPSALAVARARIAELEAENAALRHDLDGFQLAVGA